MAASTFDALGAARALESAGMERRQAEATTEQLRFAAAAGRGRLATKAAVDQVRAEMKAAIANGVDRMLFAQLAIAGSLFAALKLY